MIYFRGFVRQYLSEIAFFVYWGYLWYITHIWYAGLLVGLGIYILTTVLITMIEWILCKRNGTRLLYISPKAATIYMRRTCEYRAKGKDIFLEDFRKIIVWADKKGLRKIKTVTHETFLRALLEACTDRAEWKKYKNLGQNEEMEIPSSLGNIQIKYKGKMVNSCGRYQYKRIMTVKEFKKTMRLVKMYNIEISLAEGTGAT